MYNTKLLKPSDKFLFYYIFIKKKSKSPESIEHIPPFLNARN